MIKCANKTTLDNSNEWKEKQPTDGTQNKSAILFEFYSRNMLLSWEKYDRNEWKGHTNLSRYNIDTKTWYRL